MLIFGGKFTDGRQKQFNEFNLFVNVDSFEGTCKTDEFAGHALPGAELQFLRRQNLFLTFPTQSAGNSPPENEFLGLDAFSGMRGAIRLHAPKIIDPRFVSVATESWPEKKAGQNQPGFLMLNRARPIGIAVQERLPERSNENPIPFSLRRSEDSFKALEKIGCSQLVAPIKRTRENCLNACLRGFKANLLNSRVESRPDRRFFPISLRNF